MKKIKNMEGKRKKPGVKKWLVKTKDVVPNEYNPKIDLDENEENKQPMVKYIFSKTGFDTEEIIYHIKEVLIKEILEGTSQIQPIIVREKNGNYELIVGFYRWIAMKKLGYTKIEIKNFGKIDFDTAISRIFQTNIPIDQLELEFLMKKEKKMI